MGPPGFVKSPVRMVFVKVGWAAGRLIHVIKGFGAAVQQGPPAHDALSITGESPSKFHARPRDGFPLLESAGRLRLCGLRGVRGGVAVKALGARK